MPNRRRKPAARYPMGLPSDNVHRGPVFGDFVHGRSNGRRQPMMDCLGNRYTKLPHGREKRGGSRTKGSK